MLVGNEHNDKALIHEGKDLPFRFDPNDPGLKKQLDHARRVGRGPLRRAEGSQADNYITGTLHVIGEVEDTEDINEHLTRVKQIAMTTRMNVEFLKTEMQNVKVEKKNTKEYLKWLHINSIIQGHLTDFQQWLAGEFEDARKRKDHLLE